VATFKALIKQYDQDETPGMGTSEVTIAAFDAAQAMTMLQGIYGRSGRFCRCTPASSASSRPSAASAVKREVGDFTGCLVCDWCRSLLSFDWQIKRARAVGNRNGGGRPHDLHG